MRRSFLGFSAAVFLLVLSTTSFSAPYNAGPGQAPCLDAFRTIAGNVNFNPDGRDPSKYFGQWPGHRYYPSPEDWRDVPIYQFVTDRLRDGDPTNNEGKYGGYNLYDVSARHGGDFKGIKQSAAYIKSLGYKGIWISPVFQNGENSYHGYAQLDFTVLDDRMGTLQEFRDLVEEYHRQGMYVIVDLVVNHMANLYYFEGHPNDGAPFHLHEGEYKLIRRDQSKYYADFPENNTWYPYGNQGPVYGDDGEPHYDPGQGGYWDSDFHHNGDLGNYGDPWQAHDGKIYGSMDDLRNEHPRVANKLIAMTNALISSTDVDGFRVDTPMEVPLSFFKQWSTAVKDHARRLGKDNFFIFGELYCGRERAATMVGRGRTPEQWGQPYSFIDNQYAMDGGINYRFYFDFVYPAIKYQQGGPANAKRVLDEDLKAYDFYNRDKQHTNYVMLNFIDNHDQWRLSAEADGLRKTMLGAAVIAFWPGVPLFYYGDEQGFATSGSAVDGPGREDFMTSKAWWDRPSQSGSNPAIVDNFDMTSASYLQVQKYMNVRNQYHSLRNTEELYERWVQPNNTNGIYAFTRVWADPKNWSLVVYNTWKDPLEAGGRNGTFYTGWKEGDRIVNALSPTERYTLAKDGVLPSLWVGGYETKVFVREDNLQPLSPVVEAISPRHDAVVGTGAQTFTVRFSEEMQPDSVRQAITYDGKDVPAQRLDIAPDGRSVLVNVDVSQGIHKLGVRSSARSGAGKELMGDFSSRVRAGGDRNPIVHLQREPIEDSGLVTFGGYTPDGKVKLDLHHRADGAGYYRVSVDNGRTFDQWQPYSPQSQLEIPRSGDRLDAVVQYWADGSGAYFSHCRIDLPVR